MAEKTLIIKTQFIADDSEIQKVAKDLQTKVDDVKIGVDTSEFANIKTELKKASSTAKSEGKEAGRDYSSGIKAGISGISEQIEEELKKGANAAKKAGGEAGKGFADNISGFLDGIGGGGGIGGLLQGAIGGGVAGLASGALTMGLEALSGAVTAVIDKVQELSKLSSAVSQFTGKTGDDLLQLTGQLSGMAETYGVDSQELLNASNNITKQLGGNISDNVNLINEAFARGANIQGEFIPIITEYGNSFKELGFTAEQTMAFVTNTSKSGIFSDKAVDTVKEANLRLREMTPATQDALNAIGLSADRIQKELQSGSKTTFDIIKEVSTKLNELPDSAAVTGTAIADIFGGAGEDAGLQYLRTLKDVSLEMEKLPAAQQKIVDLQKEQTRSSARMNTAFMDAFGGLGQYITEAKIVWNDFVAQLLEWIDPWVDNIMLAFDVIYPPIKEIFDIFGALWDVLFSLAEPLTVSGKEADAMRSTSQKIADAMKEAADWIRGIADRIRVAKAQLAEFLGIADKGSSKKIEVQIKEDKELKRKENEFIKFQDAIKAVGRTAKEVSAADFNASKSKLSSDLGQLAKAGKISSEQFGLLDKQIKVLTQGTPSGSKLKDIADQIKSVVDKTKEMQAKMSTNALEDATKKQIEELKRQNQNELNAIDEQQANWTKAKDISAKQRVSMLEALGQQELAQIELNAQEESQLLDKLAVESLKKEQDRLNKKADDELRIKQAQVNTLSSQDVESIRRRYEIEREIAITENERRIKELLSQNEEYNKKEVEIERMKLSNAPLAEVQKAYETLSGIKDKILSTDALINAELILQAQALDEINLNYSLAAKEARIQSIGDLYEREREMAIFEAEKMYAETLKIAGGSQARELSAFMDLQEAKLRAMTDYANKTVSISQQMMMVVNDAFMGEFVNGITLPDNQEEIDRIKQEIEGIGQSQEELKKKYKEGLIDRKEYNSELEKLAEERKNKQQEMADAEVTIWESAAEALARVFKSISESYKESLAGNIEELVKNNKIILEIEKAQNAKIFEYVTASIEGETDVAEQANQDLAKLADAKTDKERESAKLISEAWFNAGAAMTSTFLQVAIEEKKYLKATTMALLDGLMAVIPIFVAKIFGSYSSLGPGGTIAAGAVTAGLYGLAALAKAQASRLSFLFGGENYAHLGFDGLTTPGRKQALVEYNENNEPEFIFNSRALKQGRNLDILTRANRRNASIEDMLIGDPAFMRRVTGSTPVLSAESEFSEKTYNELQKMNHKMDRLGNRPVNLKVNIEGDAQALFRANKIRKMQEARR